MGYYIHSAGSNINIPAEKIKPCIEHIIEEVNAGKPHLNSVSEEKILAACAKGNLVAVFDEYGYQMTDDGAGGLEMDYYSGEKYYSEMGEIFAMVAPFLADGSYIAFEGEEFDMFRFLIKDGRVYEQSARIEVIWPEAPKESELLKLAA